MRLARRFTTHGENSEKSETITRANKRVAPRACAAWAAKPEVHAETNDLPTSAKHRPAARSIPHHHDAALSRHPWFQQEIANRALRVAFEQFQFDGPE